MSQPSTSLAAGQAYPREPTVTAGQSLVLHVSTPFPTFAVIFYRVGLQLSHMATSSPRRGYDLPPGLPDEDWGWPAEEFGIPAEWPAGVYLAVLTAGEGAQPTRAAEPPQVDARSGRAVFVVRAAAGQPPPILYKLAWTTYHAYNASGGGSMYHTGGFVPAVTTTTLTTRRPGGGTGGRLSFADVADVYDERTPREGFAHWDLPMIRWLEREGVGVDFCTDLDLHREPALLSGYRLLLSVGHDEYWSTATRRAVQDFVAGGGNVAFFSANTSWWRVDLTADAAMTCVHPPVSLPDSGHWWRTEPENALTGVSYRQGGGWWAGPREPLGYTVQHGGHWVYDGLGLRTGDMFGGDERLVGYECDGAILDRGPGGQLRASGTDGTPENLTVLGSASLGEGWQDRPAGASATAVLGAFTAVGTVFTCGTTDWARVLDQGHPVVGGVTRNVLQRLSRRNLPVRGPFPARHRRCLAVAGAPATFHVAFPGRVPEGARFAWTAAVGDHAAEPVRGDLACRLTVPDETSLLTVTVAVEDAAGEAWFGWTTVPVLSQRDAQQVELLCQLRDLVAAAAPALSATREPGPGNWPFGDPRWDPVRDGLRTAMSPATCQQVLDRVHELARAAGLLAAANPAREPSR